MVLSTCSSRDLDRDQGRLRQWEEQRSNLYYNQYRWAVSWHQKEITAIRDSFDPAKISKVLAHRRHWMKNRWSSGGNLGRGVRPMDVNYEPIPVATELSVKDVAQYLRGSTAPYKMVLNPDHITLYTDSQPWAQLTADWACEHITLGSVLLRTAVVSLPPETVVLKRPYDYSYRTWFRSRQCTENQRIILADWVTNMGTEVYACPSLRRWLVGTQPGWQRGFTEWTQSHYFVDHNDAKLDIWMAMVCPGVVRKTQAIHSPAK